MVVNDYAMSTAKRQLCDMAGAQLRNNVRKTSGRNLVAVDKAESRLRQGRTLTSEFAPIVVSTWLYRSRIASASSGWRPGKYF